jgi:hypothetical protein
VDPTLLESPEKNREQDDRAEIGYRRAGDDQLAERGVSLPGVGEHRDHDAQGGRREDDRHEQRSLYETGRIKSQADA